MKFSDFDLGYTPKCSVYERNLKSRRSYYLKYYLPNGVRVRRPCHDSLKMAKQLCKIKELQLLSKVFDDLDRQHLGEEESSVPARATLEEALELYLEVTKSRKKIQSHRHDRSALNQYITFFKGLGKTFADEVKAVDVQLLIGHLDQKGLAISTLQSAVKMVRKYYNFLIDEAELWEGKNPVPKRVRLPNKGSRVRDRLATDEEIQRILNIDPTNLPNLQDQNIGSILRFLVFTGARLGEVLHAEWDDFDLKNGVWNLRYKATCPTKDGLGWGPKWNKPRYILLFPEALQVLQEIPKRITIGNVPLRDEHDKIIGHKEYPAKFVFPKRVSDQSQGRQNRVLGYERLDNIKHSWTSVRKVSGVENLQIKDLRTYFNWVLKSRFGFSAKEAGSYLGNSAEINEMHYTPVSMNEMANKIGRFNLSEAMGL